MEEGGRTSQSHQAQRWPEQGGTAGHWRKNIREVDLNAPLKDGLSRRHGWSTYCVQVQWATYPQEEDSLGLRRAGLCPASKSV